MMLANNLKTHFKNLALGQGHDRRGRLKRSDESQRSTLSSSSSSCLSSCQSKGRTSNRTSGKLVDLIVNEDWESLRKFLSNPNINEVESSILSGTYMIKSEKKEDDVIDIGNNALHFLCHYHPPWDVVKAIDKAHPQYLDQVDAAGRTVLHTAIQNGAEPQVVRYICSKKAAMAGKCDITGMTPLHYACKYYADKYVPAKCKDASLEDAMRDVVRTVFRNSPQQLINIEDIDECTALEYAIETDAPYKVIRYIQKACESDWKDSASSGLDHESMKDDLINYVNSSQRNLKLEMEKLGLSSRSFGRRPTLLSVMGNDNEPTTRAKTA